MSGKAYTMKEMKTIVDYLTEHKGYSETKGRKMWIDLQNSKVTNRTWQSLKETFNKRILPDICNPYYNLTKEQISSFKQGYDIEARISNRLQFRSSSHDSDAEGEGKKNTEEPDSNKDKTGEDLNQSKSGIRDSTDTLVLDKRDTPQKKQEESPAEPFRELITYSDPLTPMLQAVLHDFASDEESNDEPNMQIVEESDASASAIDPDIILLDAANSGDIHNSKTKESEKTSNNASTSNKKDTKVDEPISKENTKDNNDVSSMAHNGRDESPSKGLTVSEVKKNNPQNISTEKKLTQNASNSTTDTFLPDNQEAYQSNKTKTKEQTKNYLKERHENPLKRRATSQENPASSKKRLSEKQIYSDIDVLKKANKTIDVNKLKASIPLVVESYRDDKSKKETTNQDTAANRKEDILNEIVEVNNTSTQEIENLCLQSASLYREESSNKCSYSENNGAKDRKIDKNKNTPKEEKPGTSKTVTTTASSKANEVVKSNSESLSDSNSEPVRRISKTIRQQRNRNLANVFGSTTGGVNKNRLRKSSLRKSLNARRSISRNKSFNLNTDSSDWTSDTGPEFVSPPRGRKNRQSTAYEKPKSCRILSLGEEGGLFVKYGKKIYPVVKDGKNVKKYVSYLSEDDAEQEESYWKLKYVEEKKKTAELTKLLNQDKYKSDTDTSVPVVPSTSVSIPQVDSSVKEEEPVVPDNATKNKARTEASLVKLKLTNFNKEVQVEGSSKQVMHVLTHVVQLLYPAQRPRDDAEVSLKSASDATDLRLKCASDDADVSLKSASDHADLRLKSASDDADLRLKSASDDADVSIESASEATARVDILENEIFATIKENDNIADKEEVDENLARIEPTPERADDTDTMPNVTTKKRRGKPRKSETKDTARLVKKPKMVPELPVASRNSPRTTKKDIANKVIEKNTPKTRQNTAAKSNKMKTPKKEGRNKLTSPAGKSTNKAKKDTRNARLRKSNMYSSPFRIYASPDQICQNSIESTQGYVDSDPSPNRVTLRKRRMSSITIPFYRTKSQSMKRNAHPYMTDDTSNGSSNSFKGPVKTLTFQNSTSSDVYKSDSYQLLMNNNISVRNRNVSQKLDKIDEIVPITQDPEYMKEQNNNTYSLNVQDGSGQKDAIYQTNTDSSSNVTMPTSPVLSIVENMSISRSMLNNTDGFVFDDDLNENENERITLNNYMTPTVDVSMPLMEQECDIDTKTHDGIEYHYNLCAPKTTTIVSESFLHKINTVNIQETTSDSINDKLKNLILESTKKKTKMTNFDGKMEQGEDVNNNDRKSKSKKRSSTPRKRQSTHKLKLARNEPCIEEEHVETCSQLSRKSCPPVLQMCDEIDNINESIGAIETVVDKPKGRKKKDIIKVKINKPKKKRQNDKSDCQDEVKNNQIDSGINETQSSIFLHISEDSVDLIHNHSETCLNAHECLETSVKIIENCSQSVISIDSNSTSFNENCNNDYFRNLPDVLVQELFCNDAQDGTQRMKATSDNVTEFKQNSASDTVFHTPLGSLSSPDSLLTEDLSNNSPPKQTRNTKWYLFSEDETSNTNAVEIERGSFCGANLNEIFPITCAVPDLSTITEMSKDVDENTRKLIEDTNTKTDVDSQSLFNV